MAKTEVILIGNVVGLGAESDHVKVASGYARNYLFPQRLAIPLTAANKKQLEALHKRRAEREAHEFNAMSELARSLSKLVCIVKVRTGDDGKLFGSVTSGTIADELKHQFDIALDKRRIHLEHPIRALGEYDLDMRLHQQVPCSLKVRVESLNPPPKTEEPAPTAETRESASPRRGGSRGPRAGRPEKAPSSAAEPARASKPSRAARES
ncbi:MAG: 50S ribosomal protein L9 [Verrucomicrobia bacterium]|nr:50S ribosomal protein L9 [Verrucomicrobiota bacterium]